MAQYIAHTNKENKIQTIRNHAEGTAAYCEKFYSPLEMKRLLINAALLHDIGKYQPTFQERIRGKQVSVEHSICGALEVPKYHKQPLICKMLQYVIAGHHGGIPDGGDKTYGPIESTLEGRLRRTMENYSKYKEEINIVPLGEKEQEAILDYFKIDSQNKDKKYQQRELNELICRFAFFTRFIYSCLVDADSLDTRKFLYPDEAMLEFKSDFSKAYDAIENFLGSLSGETELQKARASLQKQAFNTIQTKWEKGQEPEIYLLNMPTGSGKTLASMKLALRRVLDGEKDRIIYIIPYNAIVDQTYEIANEILGDYIDIIRHQSSFFFEEQENLSEDYIRSAQAATENWDAPFIITTAVQFFESLYSNRRKKCQKIHNIANSILIFDEAHMMPWKYIYPCLQGISFACRFLNCEAILMTATMPNYENFFEEKLFLENRIVDLVPNKTEFQKFSKCKYEYVKWNRQTLINEAMTASTSLIVVNSKRLAIEIYQMTVGEKYHLSTYMTAHDRIKTIQQIKKALDRLHAEFPEESKIPQERKITVISTSLVETGVDLDFDVVFRQRAGLDNILQAGGRCNREGRLPVGRVIVFDLEDIEEVASPEKNIVKNMLKKAQEENTDIQSIENIERYYDELFNLNEKELEKSLISYQSGQNHHWKGGLPFREYADNFTMIEDRTVSVVIPQEETIKKIQQEVKKTKRINPRKVQHYVCSVNRKEFEQLLGQGVITDYDTGVFFLKNQDYYSSETGIKTEGNDYYF